jgi:hypothetical protein
MNRLSISILAAGVTILCGTSFSKKSTVLVTPPAISASAPMTPKTPNTTITPDVPTRHRLKMETLLRPNQTLYYWYSYPYDTYNDRKTLNDEIYEMWFYYAALVDTDPSGGVLIEKGYYTGAYPHNQLPSYFLYVHYVYQAQ